MARKKKRKRKGRAPGSWEVWTARAKHHQKMQQDNDAGPGSGNFVENNVGTAYIQR